MNASKSSKSIANFWLAVGIISCLAVPWYAIDDGFLGLEWLVADYIFDSATSLAICNNRLRINKITKG
jgi:hypothetical protein